MKTEFSSFDVLKILDIEKERFLEWIKKGFVAPTVKAKGRGTRAAFSLLDIYKIAVFNKLLVGGFERRKAAELVKTNSRINNPKDVKNLSYILVLGGRFGGEWLSCLDPGPWNLEETVTKRDDWDISVLINFKKLRLDIERSIVSLFLT